MRKIQAKRFKTTAVFLASLILLQGCVVYHKTPTTLEQASQEQIKTKITTTENETIKYKYITFEDGAFYGVNKKKGELVKSPLNGAEIEKILTKNKSASTWATVITIAVPVIAIIIFAATYEVSVGSGVVLI